MPKKILLVEDDPFLIDIYTHKFKKEGFEMEVKKDGESALKYLRETDEKPVVVLLDIVLPGEEGWEILKRIKQDENLKGLRVIILSNLGEKENIKKGLELGAEKYLIKSNFTPSQVVEEVKQILGG